MNETENPYLVPVLGSIVQRMSPIQRVASSGSPPVPGRPQTLCEDHNRAHSVNQKTRNTVLTREANTPSISARFWFLPAPSVPGPTPRGASCQPTDTTVSHLATRRSHLSISTHDLHPPSGAAHNSVSIGGADESHHSFFGPVQPTGNHLPF